MSVINTIKAQDLRKKIKVAKQTKRGVSLSQKEAEYFLIIQETFEECEKESETKLRPILPKLIAFRDTAISDRDKEITKLEAENKKLKEVLHKIKALDSPDRKESYENDFDIIMDLIEPFINELY